MPMSFIATAVAILVLVILAAVPVIVWGDFAPAGFWGAHPERNQFAIVMVLWAIIVTALVVAARSPPCP